MLLTVAVIGPAHALKGEVRLEIRTDDPEGRLLGGSARARRAPRGRPAPRQARPSETRLPAARLGWDGTRWFAVVEEARARTAAEALRGVRLLVDTDAVGGSAAEGSGDADDEAWYAHELIGLRAVRALPGAEPQHLGEVVDLEPGVAQDRIVVRTPDGEEVAVPFVEQLVPGIDPEAGVVTLDPPGGLFPGVGRTEEAR